MIQTTFSVESVLNFTEEEFSSFISELKTDYKKFNKITSKKKSVRAFSLVMQKINRMSKHLKKKCGDWGRNNYMNLQILLDLVFEQNKEELDAMNYTMEKFKIEYACEVALLLANRFFTRSCEQYCVHLYEKPRSSECGITPEAITMACFCVMKGTQYFKNNETGKRVAKDYKRIACTEGITAVLDDDSKVFHEFGNIWHYLGRCEAVKQLYEPQASDELKNLISQNEEDIIKQISVNSISESDLNTNEDE